MAHAKAWGLTPSAWMNLPRVDRALIAAHEANEAERCGRCGFPLVGPEELEDTQIMVQKCVGCETRDRHEKRHKPGKFDLLSVIPILRRNND